MNKYERRLRIKGDPKVLVLHRKVSLSISLRTAKCSKKSAAISKSYICCERAFSEHVKEYNSNHDGNKQDQL